MNSLIYLSPVPWASFAQRSHRFAEWFHGETGGRVLWVDPYPTRLPRAQDLRRLVRSAREPANATPHWMRVLRPAALPIEPLPGASWVNARLWRDLVAELGRFAAESESCELVIGKPSQLALRVVHNLRFERTAYDAMDDFPEFHRGISRRVLAHTEQALARAADLTLASSTRLVEKFKSVARQVVLARNACDPATLPPVAALAAMREHDLVGYVGTIASWFDWDGVLALAALHPMLRFRFTGPIHGPVPASLPSNVALRPACSHEEAMREMSRFAVGLIPFRLNGLTMAVDPVKYYEYRALGVPVVSSAFGEMPVHAAEDSGLRLLDGKSGANLLLKQALEHRDTNSAVQRFREENAWSKRFATAFGTCLKRAVCAGG